MTVSGRVKRRGDCEETVAMSGRVERRRQADVGVTVSGREVDRRSAGIDAGDVDVHGLAVEDERSVRGVREDDVLVVVGGGGRGRHG